MSQAFGTSKLWKYTPPKAKPQGPSLLDNVVASVMAKQAQPQAAPVADTGSGVLNAATRRQQGTQPGSGPADLKPGGGWGGTEALIKGLVKIAGVPEGSYSGKRSQPSAVAGTRSDHYVGNKNAYASDISFGSQTPTPLGDAYATKIVEALGGPKNWGKTGGNFTTTLNGMRYQVIYRSQVGGNHNNHVHVGVHKA